MSRRGAWCRVFLLGAALGAVAARAEVELRPGLEIRLVAPASEPLANALDIVQRDLVATLGAAGRVVADDSVPLRPGSLVIVQEGGTVGGQDFAPLAGFERHRLFVRDGCLVAQGADLRGTLFALMAVSEQVLGIPPLWFWASFVPERRERIAVAADLAYDSGEPHVRYRAWFPNDTDYLSVWRYREPAFNGIWLETMLRLKLNCLDLMGDNKDNMAGDARDYTQPFPLPENVRQLRRFGLRPSFTHINPLNGPFSLWESYWRDHRHQEPPELALANLPQIEEFWRYNVRTLVHHGLDPLWTINIRGRRDEPFWRTFADAPEGMPERGAVISRLVARQRQILREETGREHPDTRMVFYDELSDLLAEGWITPPTGPGMIWNFVATRRDHYPNEDLRTVQLPDGVALGYYMNLQFTSTGSHLVPAEGPWKMERNFRFVDSRRPPLRFAVVNAGNIREHVMELAAHARLMWDFDGFGADAYLEEHCRTYFGAELADEIAGLYRDYYASFWEPRRPEWEGFARQFLFHDLRYKQAVNQLTQRFFDGYDPNPLKDYPTEHVAGRTFRIMPADHGAADQIGALLAGTTTASARLENLVARLDRMRERVAPDRRPFFDDNLRVHARVMLHLNRMLRHCVEGYRETDPGRRRAAIEAALTEVQAARTARDGAAHGPFVDWHANDRVFDFADLIARLERVRDRL